MNKNKVPYIMNDNEAIEQINSIIANPNKKYNIDDLKTSQKILNHEVDIYLEER